MVMPALLKSLFSLTNFDLDICDCCCLVMVEMQHERDSTAKSCLFLHFYTFLMYTALNRCNMFENVRFLS